MVAINDIFQGNVWLLPVLFLCGGLLVGIFADAVVLPIIKGIAGKTKWHFDDIIVKSLRGMFIAWFGILGAYVAVASLGDEVSTYHAEKIAATLKVLLIVSLTVLAMRICVGLFRRYSQKATAIPGVSIFTNVIRGVILVIGFLIILQALGISITPILTALGVGGLAVALALQDTLSNLFAGIHIIASRQIKPGDYVKLESGEEGYVTDISWRNTSIRALPNNMFIVPNSKMASSIITNYYQPEQEMSLVFPVGVSYGSDLPKVEKVTIEVAKEVLARVQGGVSTFEPFIRYHTFADFSINFSVILRVKEFVDQYLVKHEFVKALHKRYNQEGIEIPFPIRTVLMPGRDQA